MTATELTDGMITAAMARAEARRLQAGDNAVPEPTDERDPLAHPCRDGEDAAP
jgi:hypothetical protein